MWSQKLIFMLHVNWKIWIAVQKVCSEFWESEYKYDCLAVLDGVYISFRVVKTFQGDNDQNLRLKFIENHFKKAVYYFFSYWPINSNSSLHVTWQNKITKSKNFGVISWKDDFAPERIAIRFLFTGKIISWR